MLLASLLLGWHVQVMMDAAGGRQFQVIKDRLIVAAMLFFTCLVLYGAAYRQIRQRLDIIVLPFDFPSLNANAGTSLLMYKKLDQMVFQKGMMVIYRNSPAMILALPGDRITLEQEFKVNGVVIRREILPQRSPLATEALPGEGTVEQGNIFTKKELVVGPGQMAIAIPVRSYVRGSIDDWNQMRLVSRQSISSYAIGIWLPIRTRYWFRPEDFASFPNLPVRQK
jgi:hypothetical protein